MRLLKLAVTVVLVGAMLLVSNIAFADDDKDANGPLGFVMSRDQDCTEAITPEGEIVGPGFEIYTVLAFIRSSNKSKKVNLNLSCDDGVENTVAVEVGQGVFLDVGELSNPTVTCVISLVGPTDINPKPAKRASVVVTADIFSCLKADIPGEFNRPSRASRNISLTGKISRANGDGDDD